MTEHHIINSHFICIRNGHNINGTIIKKHSMLKRSKCLLLRHSNNLIVTSKFNFTRDHGGIQYKSVHFLINLKNPSKSFFSLFDVFTNILHIGIDRCDFSLLLHRSE